MGSYCALRFDDVEVCSAKSWVPDEFCAVFQESDRQVRDRTDGESEWQEVSYVATRDIVLARLKLLGCTATVAREQLTEWLAEERETWNEYRLGKGGEWALGTAEALDRLTVEEWYERAPSMIVQRDDGGTPSDAIARHMTLHQGGSWLWFAGDGSLISLRALLDACPDVRVVTLDVTDLVGGGWLDPSEAVCRGRRKSELTTIHPVSPTVILAEGKSDIAVLRRSLSCLFPEREEFFSFFEHSELKVDGGAGYLVKFLKAFAAAQAALRVVAVFDNDTAGVQALKQTQEIDLPSNIMAVRLPDTEFARRYPTIGPQGCHVVDVNGTAASIELYLGRDALTVNGESRPVRWVGYNSSIGSYQGEVEDKAQVVKAFLRQLEVMPDQIAARNAFPELVRVWMSIFSAVERYSEEVMRQSPRSEW